MNLNRSDIVDRLAKRMNMHGADDIELVISVVLDAIKQRLTVGERVELRGFGSFHTTYRKARLGRNPRSGLRVAVAGKWVPHFKPGKEMRSGVNSRIDAKVPPRLLSPVVSSDSVATTYAVEQAELSRSRVA